MSAGRGGHEPAHARSGAGVGQVRLTTAVGACAGAGDVMCVREATTTAGRSLCGSGVSTTMTLTARRTRRGLRNRMIPRNARRPMGPPGANVIVVDTPAFCAAHRPAEIRTECSGGVVERPPVIPQPPSAPATSPIGSGPGREAGSPGARRGPPTASHRARRRPPPREMRGWRPVSAAPSPPAPPRAGGPAADPFHHQKEHLCPVRT